MKTTLNFKHRTQSIQFNQNWCTDSSCSPPPPIYVNLSFFLLSECVHDELIKQTMSHVCNIMVRKGWLSGEEGGHHRLSGISMYASPKCNCIMNDFLRGLIKLLTLTLVWEKLTHQCHMCVILWWGKDGCQGEEGSHHRLSGISMYASPKCNFIMNYFYVV